MISKGGLLVCPRCGYTVKPSQSLVRSTYLPKVRGTADRALDLPPGAVYDPNIKCPRCGANKVYYWIKHKAITESSDEIEKTYKCTACGYSWSET